MNTNVFPVAAYSLTSDKLDLVKIREIAQFELLPLLSSIKGVQRVEVLGGAAREIRVDADPHGWQVTASRWTTSPRH